MKALAYIALENRNGAERGDALKFQKLLQTFEFVLILALLTKVQSTLLQFICSRNMLILKLCII